MDLCVTIDTFKQVWIYDVFAFIMRESFCIVVENNFLRVMPERPFATQKLRVPVIILWYGPVFRVEEGIPSPHPPL